MTRPSDPHPDSDRWPVPGPDALDLAASESLDGWPAEPDGTTLDDTARSDEDVAARVAQLRSVIRAVSDPVHQPDTSIRDEQVRLALVSGQARAIAPSGIRDGRVRAKASSPGARRWLAAAAAIVVLVAGGLVLAHLASGGSRGVQSASVAGQAAATTTRPAAQPQTASPAAGATSDSLDQLLDLGSAENVTGLLALVRQRQGQGGLANTPTTTAPEPGGSPTAAAAGAAGTDDGATCVTAVRTAHPDLGPVELVGRATLAGQTVEVLVLRAGPAPGDVGRLLAVRPTDCQVVVDQPT